MNVSSVQFYGIDAVLKAYENADVPRFGLFAGKNLLLKYDGWSREGFTEPSIDAGIQLLNDYLSNMYQATTAIYTLKVYEDIGEKDKIKPSTEYSSAFSFKIGEPVGLPGGGVVGGVVGQELKKINERLDRIDNVDDLDDDVEEKNFVQTITGGMIKDMGELRELVDLVKPFFVGQQPEPVRSVGNINKVSDISSEVDTESEKWNRVRTAFASLELLDSKFIEHFELLADIAKRDPAQFKHFLLILESLK